MFRQVDKHHHQHSHYHHHNHSDHHHHHHHHNQHNHNHSHHRLSNEGFWQIEQTIDSDIWGFKRVIVPRQHLRGIGLCMQGLQKLSADKQGKDKNSLDWLVARLMAQPVVHGAGAAS